MCLDCLRDARKVQVRCDKIIAELEQKNKKSGILSRVFLDGQIKEAKSLKEDAKKEEYHWLKMMN